MRHRFACFALLVALVVPAAAQDRSAQVQTAFARAQHLKRGINASMWFAQSPQDYSNKHLDGYMDASDFALIAKLGFDHVRLSIDAKPLAESLGLSWGKRPGYLERLDRTVDAILANGLAVLIDVHPEEDFKKSLNSGSESVEQFTALWSALAAHYANRDPDRVFFEILNEPEVGDAYRWAGIQAHVAAAIRAAAPRQTLIAAGGMWSDIWDLIAIEPLTDGNVIYNFHFYEPHEFTHQGAGWGTGWWHYTHNIPYPATESSMPDGLKQVPDAVDRYLFEKYWLDNWNAHRIQLMIDVAAGWARDHKVPLTCNEFGVFRDFSDVQSRTTWLHDVRTALETDGIGWAMWDYRGNFGVVFKEDGQPAKVDEGVAKALGLNVK